MTNPARSKAQEQQSRMTGLYIYLDKNAIQVGILLMLVMGGVLTLIIRSLPMRQVQITEKPRWVNKDWLESRYGHVSCAEDPHCRQLKRVYEEGGASREAIRKNILSVDKNLTIEQLQENAAKYEGTPWAFEGKIYGVLYQEKRGIGDYIIAEVMIGDDPGKLISIRGDFRTDFNNRDYVYVVGYLTGMSYPRLGSDGLKYKGKVPSLSARAMLKPIEAREYLR